MLLNDDIVDTENPNGIYLTIFDVDEYLVLFFRLSVFLLNIQDLC